MGIKTLSPTTLSCPWCPEDIALDDHFRMSHAVPVCVTYEAEIEAQQIETMRPRNALDSRSAEGAPAG